MPKKSRYEQFIDSIIEEEGFLEHPKNIGDGVMTLGSGLTAKKWHDLYKKHGNKWSKKDNRIAVMEEIENARKRVKQHIKNFDKLPKDAQEVILDIEYNTGAVNPKSSPNFVKAINSGDTAEAARQMDWGNTDPTFGNGLRKRNQRRAEKFLNSFDGKITTINTDNGKKMIFPLPDWAKGEKRLPNTVVPKLPSQDFPLNPEDRTAPSLDSWNGANSPAYGGNTPRIKGIQEYMNDQQNELNHVLPGTLAIDNQPTASIFPSLDQLMSYGKELFVRDITGAPSIYDNALNNPTINKFLIPTLYANKGKDLPKLDDGKDEEPIDGGTPFGITVTGKDTRPAWKRMYQNKNLASTDPYFNRDIIKGITEWIPGIGDIQQAFDAANMFNDGRYIDAALVGGGLVIPKALSNPAKAAVKKLPAEKIKQITDNFIKFANKHKNAIERSAKDSQYNEFVKRFGDVLDMNRISPDNVHAGMRGRKEVILSITSPHSVYDGKGVIKYIDGDNTLGSLSLYDDELGQHVGSIVSYKPGTGRKLYDSGILAAQQDLGAPGIISGDKLLMFPLTYSTWKHFPNKQLLGKYGKHTNGSVFTQNGNVYLLNEPSQYVPTKHEYMFDPSIIDSAGNMHVDLGNPSIFNVLYPTIGGAALYNNIYTEGLDNYNKGKDIYIKPSKRGTFTAAAKKRGKSVQEFASQVLANPGNYSPAMRKKALFARNSKKFKH